MKLWGGRYKGEPDQAMHELNRSIDFDQRLWKADLEGSIAWARELRSAGLLSGEEVGAIVEGLRQIMGEWEAGAFEIHPSDEDIHSANERRLTELIGEVAGKLHTGRSRNDQVATDIRLYLRGEWEQLEGEIRGMQAALVEQAERGMDLLMPGYTHLQQAQPIRWSHWLLQWVWMLERDRERFADASHRANASPLGAGALAGNSLGIDRENIAAALGFNNVMANSLDAVSARDFILEILAAAAILGTHLSRLAEDLILYASAEFRFVQLDPRFTTGSSLMPQKANPDALELARGKSGRLIGNLVSLLTTVKGLPSTYNKDLQEDKEPLFDSVDTLHALLPVLTELIATLEPQGKRMRAALDDAMLATDLADYLVRHGVPFRQAHHLVGQAVAAAEKRGVLLGALSLEEYRAIHDAFDEDLYDLFDFEHAVDAKTSLGGTARDAVEAQLEAAKQLLVDEG
ncbi:MAG: argininosuccinate lyase [Chloroflexota bacterium]|nr:argininosuccinate lyase [Chloroflexota bacterium]